MLRKALNSDLLSGRKDGGCYISFNWLFNPKNYEALMEGTFDNPTVAASAGKKPQHSSSPPPAPPQPQREETNEEIEARLRMKEERKKAEEKEQTEALRQKYLGWIEAAKKNPNGSMAKMVKDAYKNGTLAKLGIVWNPSVAEEEQSLADLDDQTQNYLQVSPQRLKYKVTNNLIHTIMDRQELIDRLNGNYPEYTQKKPQQKKVQREGQLQIACVRWFRLQYPSILHPPLPSQERGRRCNKWQEDSHQMQHRRGPRRSRPHPASPSFHEGWQRQASSTRNPEFYFGLGIEL